LSKTLNLQKMVLFFGMLALLVVTIAAPAEAARKKFRGIPVTGTLEDGGTFAGKILYRNLSVSENEAGDGLVLSGVIRGVARLEDGTRRQIQEPFSTEIVSLQNGGGEVSTSQVSCDILNLDLAPIHLDLLGLVVDLDEVHLDITGLTGAGKLLGNLLCGLLGILDPPEPPA
jgi:hypothetical protein